MPEFISSPALFTPSSAFLHATLKSFMFSLSAPKTLSLCFHRWLTHCLTQSWQQPYEGDHYVALKHWSEASFILYRSWITCNNVICALRASNVRHKPLSTHLNLLQDAQVTVFIVALHYFFILYYPHKTINEKWRENIADAFAEPRPLPRH